jgi:EmrB/QacA subfamily drug resistance transporter
MTTTKTNHSSNETWVLLATVLASAMAFIDATALNVALPAIQSQLHATGTELLWIVNAYAVVTAALILFGGALGDGFGRARVFGIGIGLFVIASLGCGLAANTESLIISRVFQGLGAALMIPGSLSLISATFEPSRRGRAIGIWSACSVVMSALGPIIGGLLADAGMWRAIFFINLPIGLLCLAVLITKVSTTDRSKASRLDYMGAILSILGLACLNYGLLEVASRGWSDPVVIAAIVVSICCLVAFVWNESKSARPLLPLSLFRNRTLVAASQLTLCFYSGLYGMLFFVALNLIQVQDYPASIAGLAQLPVMLLVILLSPVSGRMVDRYGPRVPLTCGGVLGMLGFMLLARPGLTSGPSDYWIHFFPPLALLGLAMGMSAAPLSTTIMNSVPQRQVGVGSGINSTLSRLSAVLGLAALGPIAILSFSRSLMLQSQSFSLSGEAVIALQQESRRLADAMPPSGMSPEMTDAVEHAIRIAYVDAFRIVACVSAITVGLSTVLAAALIERRSAHE